VQSHHDAGAPRVGIGDLFGRPQPSRGSTGGATTAKVASADHGAAIASNDETSTQSVTATIPKPAGAKAAEPSAGGGGADLVGEPIVSNLDTIAPTITFQGGITRGGTIGSGDFGTTNSTPAIKDIVIAQASGAFTVTATFSLTTTWDTCKGTGPNHEVDIASENSPALTAANYPTAVSDLTPNMSDLGGRPPRTQFWAQDLTERHEKVHAADHQRTGKEGMAQAITWLKTQTATTEAEVRTLLTTARNKIVAYIVANGAGDVGEVHAYSDGAASYKARADAIKAKGDKKEYK